MMNLPPAHLLQQKQVFKRHFSLDVVEIVPRSLSKNGYGVPLEREVMRVGHVAGILLYCPETDQILLNQQFRVGAFLNGDETPHLYECAAGAVDEGESPEQAATREALEETGMVLKDLVSAGWFYTSPGTLDEKCYVYVGRIDRPQAGIHGMLEEGEEIKTHIFSSSQILEMLDNGQLRNAITMNVVAWFGRHYASLRHRWSTPA